MINYQDNSKALQKQNDKLTDREIKLERAIEILRKYVYECPNKYSFETIDDMATDFLKSISKTECQLYNGGYIKDKNGNICCDGDKVKIHFLRHESLIEKYTQWTTGTLYWSENSKSFGVQLQDGECVNWQHPDEGIDWFEKIL